MKPFGAAIWQSVRTDALTRAAERWRYADMNQATEQWERFAGEFYRDGSLRDIYVSGADLQHWISVAIVIARKYKTEFSGAWQETSVPSESAKLFPRVPVSELTVLVIDVSGVRLNCQFFTPDEIESDLDPAEVGEPSKLDAVFTFMKGLASAIGKDVQLTPEGMPEIAIFRWRPNEDKVEHTFFGGSS